MARRSALAGSPGQACAADRHRDRGGGHGGGQGRQPETRRAGEQADGEGSSDDEHAEHVGEAGEEEEGDAPPRDPVRRHAATVKRPGAEGQAAQTAGGQHGVGAELREADLGAGRQAHRPAEHAAKDEHIRDAREDLEHDARADPDRIAVTQARAQAGETGHQRDQHDDDDRERQQPEQASAQTRAGDLGRRCEVIEERWLSQLRRSSRGLTRG